MRNIVFLLLSIPSILLSQNKVIDHKINQVTIFLSGANVKSVGEIYLKKGRHVIEFRNLSSSINLSTIRPSIDKGTILSVKNKLLSDVSNKEALLALQQIKDSVFALEAEVVRLNYEVKTYQKEKSLLDHNMSRVGAENSISIQELEQATKFYRSHLNKVEKLEAETRLELQNKTQVLTDVTTRYEVLQKRKDKLENAALVECEILEEGIYHFDLEYYTEKAAWKPSYNVRCHSISDPLFIEYNGLVKNMTGIDWTDVNVVLSTADPLVSNEIPVLKPWSLSYSSKYQMLQEKNRQLNKADNKSKEFKNTDENKQSKQTVIDVSAVSTNFSIVKKHSIPTDSSIHQVKINSRELETAYEHLSVPKVNSNVYLTANVKGWESLNLISGEANIYFSGSYIGKTFIELDQTEDELKISLGNDKKVIVERLKKEDLGSKKFIGTNRKVTLEYEIIVKNTHSEAVNIKLIDQVPISRESNITVDVKNISDAAQDESTGELTWDINLSANQSVSKGFSVEIKYPRNKLVLIRRPEYARTRF